MITPIPDPAVFRKNCLVLYKSSPARVLEVDNKLHIELDTGETLSVRPKDLTLLHPGPLTSLAQLVPLTCEADEARSLLAGGSTTLAELAELLYGEFTPAGAWAAWCLVQDGLWFYGTPESVQVRTDTEFEVTARTRKAKADEKEAWGRFIADLHEGRVADNDRLKLQELESFALGRSKQSRILKELNIAGTLENAHKLLIRLGQWDEQVNPYIERLGFTKQIAYPSLPALPAEERLDLTHLAAYAIDDAGNQDPDDAIGSEGAALWVHVADAAALIPPDSEADLLARSQGATHYLPEQQLTMLPQAATELLGLGLREVSPALSFRLTLDEAGAVDSVSLHKTWVKVTRLTYAEAQERLCEEPFAAIRGFTDKHAAHRRSRGAVFLRFPEVKIRVREGRVTVTPLPALDSQELVTEAMLMAGTGAGRLAAEHRIPLPYAVQPPASAGPCPVDWAGMYAFRRHLAPGTTTTAPGLHAGLGLEAYSRATSPLRRYPDLVTHQQLRAHLNGKAWLDEQAVSDRVAAYNAVSGGIQKLERLSNQHWTLVYLMQNPGWEGGAVVVDKKGSFCTVLIPELGMETGLNINLDLPLNGEIGLRCTSVDLSVLNAHFKAIP